MKSYLKRLFLLIYPVCLKVCIIILYTVLYPKIIAVQSRTRKQYFFKIRINIFFYEIGLFYSPSPGYTDLHDLIAFQTRILDRWPTWL